MTGRQAFSQKGELAGGSVELLANTFIWCSPLSDRRLSELAPRVAAFGFDGIELPLENVGDWDPDAAASVLKDCRLSCAVGAVMPPGRELVATDPLTLGRTQDYLRACLDCAATVGAPMVSGPVYASVGRVWRATPDERAALVEDLRQALLPVAQHAASVGVAIGLEPLNRYETSLVNTSAQAMEILDGLPAAGIGVALDAYHMNIEERSLSAAVRTAGSRLLHVQVSGNDRGAPGGDGVDWDDLAHGLGEIGYRGMVSIESFTPDNETIARAASIWRPLAESQDAIATDGLPFLRRWVEQWVGVQSASGDEEGTAQREPHEEGAHQP
ncbi:MAG TPA: sugar phosphate isomerase/epimerase family protein [Acidimicrobiales bacterium]|nr:sugar phosphate isomerase/epimerase family protein [Acidimicrobiales bacterium]